MRKRAMVDHDLVSDAESWTDRVTLEEMVDRYSLANVVEALVALCHTKAEHLTTNWQDPSSARDWVADARTLDRVVSKLRHAG